MLKSNNTEQWLAGSNLIIKKYEVMGNHEPNEIIINTNKIIRYEVK